jgi:hypothetical protein
VPDQYRLLGSGRVRERRDHLDCADDRKLSRTSGRPGATVTLNGINLSRATAVSFNGNAAKITSDSATSLVTSVPTGAKSGEITVTTPLGRATSPAAFSVRLPESVLGPGQGLSTGWSLQSVGGQFSLVMQRDGNLVLYTSSNRALWSTGTENNAGASVVMQRDGNLVVYSSSNRALWASGTENNAGASAVLQRDGNFVIYSAGGRALWSSGT